MWERAVRWISDWYWVLGTFIHGKVFRVPKYKPRITAYTDGVRLVNFEVFIRASLMKKLMLLWGCRLEIEDSDELIKTATLKYLQRDVADVSKIEMKCPYNGTSTSGEYEDKGYSYDDLCDTSVIIPETPDCLRVI